MKAPCGLLAGGVSGVAKALPHRYRFRNIRLLEAVSESKSAFPYFIEIYNVEKLEEQWKLSGKIKLDYLHKSDLP